MHEELCCGIIRGTFYARKAGTTEPFLPLGNAEAEITQEMTEITQPNYQSLGGNACKVEYPESVNLNLTLHCTNPKNMALAFLGSATKLTGGTITDEEIGTALSEEQLLPTLHIPDQTQTVTVKNGATTYVRDTDYSVTSAGILILEGSAIPLDPGTALTATYSYGANWTVDAQTVSQATMEIILDGINYGGEEAKPVTLRAWKVKLAPTENFAIISGTEFASLVLNGEMLKDSSHGQGLSQFFRMEYATKAEGAY